MNYSLIQQGDTVQSHIGEFACDTREDISSIPVDKWAAGSSCIVIEDSSIWMLGMDKEWHEL